MYKLISTILALFVAASHAIPKAVASRSAVLGNLKTDPEGFVHFADDGVVRSYSASDTVIDFMPLSNEMLLEAVEEVRPFIGEDYEHLLEVFRQVDGHDVTDTTQIWDPPENLRPLKPTHQQQSRNTAAPN